MMKNPASIVLLRGGCAGVVPANKGAASDALRRCAGRLDEAQLGRALALADEDLIDFARWFTTCPSSAWKRP